jgi:hypothetical protein
MALDDPRKFDETGMLTGGRAAKRHEKRLEYKLQ